MHQASNLHNIIKIGAWAEPYVNFIYRETPPPPYKKEKTYISDETSTYLLDVMRI